MYMYSVHQFRSLGPMVLSPRSSGLLNIVSLDVQYPCRKANCAA